VPLLKVAEAPFKCSVPSLREALQGAIPGQGKGMTSGDDGIVLVAQHILVFGEGREERTPIAYGDRICLDKGRPAFTMQAWYLCL
jgi:hypothetical protein